MFLREIEREKILFREKTALIRRLKVAVDTQLASSDKYNATTSVQDVADCLEAINSLLTKQAYFMANHFGFIMATIEKPSGCASCCRQLGEILESPGDDPLYENPLMLNVGHSGQRPCELQDILDQCAQQTACNDCGRQKCKEFLFSFTGSYFCVRIQRKKCTETAVHLSPNVTIRSFTSDDDEHFELVSVVCFVPGHYFILLKNLYNQWVLVNDDKCTILSDADANHKMESFSYLYTFRRL